MSKPKVRPDQTLDSEVLKGLEAVRYFQEDQVMTEVEAKALSEAQIRPPVSIPPRKLPAKRPRRNDSP